MGRCRDIRIIGRCSGTGLTLTEFSLRVAIVHHWLVTWRGGERVLAEICRLFPGAPIHTLFGSPQLMPEPIASHPGRTSFLDAGRRFREWLLPLYPLGVRSLDLRDYDLVISSDASVAKGVRTRPDAIHLCYCHAPARYAWDFPEEYVRAQIPAPLRPLAYAGLAWIRHYDRRAASRVDAFATNSEAVASRIDRHYGREAAVVPPPVDLERFAPDPATSREEFYLCAGQLVPYKCADLAVEACRRTGRRLVVVGEGPLESRLRAMAGDGIEFRGACPDAELRDLYQRCRALIFPGEEDFGIVPLEAMACGAPVVALGRGGALETVIGSRAGEPPPLGATGLFFDEPSVPSLCAALDAFESGEQPDPAATRRRALEFSPQVFRQAFAAWVNTHTPGAITN